MMKIVLVEDDFSFRAQQESYFTQHGYEVVLSTESSAAELVKALQPEIVIIGLANPGCDSLGLCRQIRPHVSSKILLLTPFEDDIEHVAALEIGADDFIQKPVSLRVLLARIRALLRRKQFDKPEKSAPVRKKIEVCNDRLVCGSLKLNNARKCCMLGTEQVSLTGSEFDLLWLLASRSDEVLSREFLVKTIRGIDYDGIDRTIDNKVVTLRKKLGDTPSFPRKIITVRSKGYLFTPDSW
ncbi:response regulator transcription factor [Photobacterium sp. OFAV2-7]|uniref:response regulator transcription factor n=1 Tax=Photobacterium sp. OFAV2-7 TaxID=2917748 RepID=UPI001EF3F480|nr:response regulator transcription factor [Photobacterium sp. OFAV2-7]MCG7585849.1 response regulator transcription factor [Photobacterium sp. OFAV2-7]